MEYKCRRRSVKAIVESDDRVFFGHNHRSCNSSLCPRRINQCGSGEGYDLCKNECGQESHAEVDAIKKAGQYANGATLYLFGHDYACDDCIKIAKKAGIKKIILIKESEVLWSINQ